MAYIGNIPAESYASFERQVFTIVNSQTAYTLTHAVTNENDIRLVVNNVVQEPGSGKAYTASGTTLTLSAALVNGTDEMYCVYLGRALQTVNPPNASVGNSQTAPTIITGQTAETSIATDDTILIHDTSASALRKMTRANFVSGIGGTNTPNFFVYKNSSQTISDATATKITWTTEVFDTASAFASDKFTVPSGQAGKYLFSFASHTYDASEKLTQSNKAFYKNGSQVGSLDRTDGTYEFVTDNRVYTILLNLSVGDYIETYVWGNTTDNTSFSVYGEGQYYTYFQGFKIIE